MWHVRQKSNHFSFHIGMFDHGRAYREDSSTSDDGGDAQSAIFVVGDGNDVHRSAAINSSNAALTQSSSIAALNATPAAIIIPTTVGMTFSNVNTTHTAPLTNNTSDRSVRLYS